MTGAPIPDGTPGVSDGLPLRPELASPPVIHQMLMTRFNLRILRSPGAYRDPAWLEKRFRMMSRFAAPAIRSQRWPHFLWWLLCDVSTRPALLADIRALDTRVRIALIGDEAEIDPAARPLADACAATFAEVASVLDPAADITMSTRFDSDDCLARDFTQRVVDRLPIFLASGQPRFLVVAASGYQWDVQRKYATPLTHPRIAMQTLYERADRVDVLKGAYIGNHGAAPTLFPGCADMEHPAWLYVIHDANDSGFMQHARQRLTADDLRDRFAAEW